MMVLNSCFQIQYYGANHSRESDQYEETKSTMYVSNPDTSTFKMLEDSIVFVEIDSNYLNNQLLKESQNGWVYYMSYWCANCIQHIDQFSKMSEEHDVKFIPISTSYDVKRLRKNLGYSNYKGIIYILNHSYGETETEKYFKFRKMYIGEGINEQFSVPTSDFFIAGKYAKTIIGAGKINDELLESLKTH
ncbi:MAG: hypothetical protein CL843_09990 [Crocinitomicaceae bacterium]|nr:hypothetical protein [Crocinitomicaceae bacterium]